MRGPDERRTARSRSLRRSETEVERRLWLRLRNRQIAGCKFVCQEPVGPYFVDFACRERKLVVELDGSQHIENARDGVRDAYLASRGYRVLRFWNSAVIAEMQSVLDTIYAALTEGEDGASDPPLPAGGERSSRRQPTG